MILTYASEVVDLTMVVPEALRQRDPLLDALDPLLADTDLLAAVRADFCQRSPRSATRGRHSTPVEVILRLLVVRRLFDWTYEETVWRVSDSISLRQFCRLGTDAVPDASTLDRWAMCLTAATLDAVNARLVQHAVAAGITHGRRLRLDCTVVETTMHYPSDSTLLADGVRVLGRLLGRARQQCAGPATLFRNRVRSARRLARRIGESTRRRGEAGAAVRTTTYRALLAIARATMRQSAAVEARLDPAVSDLAAAMRTMRERLGQVVTQTTRRLAGEPVPAAEKLVSLFEPHTAIIRRDKPRVQTEYGHKVLLGECEGGIISQAVVLAGNAADAEQLAPALAAHCAAFGHAPALLATDRGFWRSDCEAQCHARGVRRVAIPRSGTRTGVPPRPVEREPWFRRAQRFRAGGEGRISVCKRRGHLGRCRDRGEAGFDRWIAWGALANNLWVIGTQ
jgi:transposase, IS5 family